MAQSHGRSAGQAAQAGHPRAGNAFVQLCEAVQNSTGVRMNESKRLFATTRLRRRMRAQHLSELDAYCAYALATPDELQRCVEDLVTHHTSFFREAAHFEALTQRLLCPQQQHATVWCAASSSGEEAYSLAIALDQWARGAVGRSHHVYASDISERVLATASAGVYSQDKVTLPQPSWLELYFQKGKGQQAGKCRVKAAVRATVDFFPHNLLHKPSGALARNAPFDVVFCRNALIYFEPHTQHQVVDLLLAHLKPAGHLVVGHSEHVNAQLHAVVPLGGGIYKKSPR